MTWIYYHFFASCLLVFTPLTFLSLFVSKESFLLLLFVWWKFSWWIYIWPCFRWCHGSPVHRYGLYALQWIVEVNGKRTPDLEAFVSVTKVYLNTMYVILFSSVHVISFFGMLVSTYAIKKVTSWTLYIRRCLMLSPREATNMLKDFLKHHLWSSCFCNGCPCDRLLSDYCQLVAKMQGCT